jgi:hypothetical protein
MPQSPTNRRNLYKFLGVTGCLVVGLGVVDLFPLSPSQAMYGGMTILSGVMAIVIAKRGIGRLPTPQPTPS